MIIYNDKPIVNLFYSFYEKKECFSVSSQFQQEQERLQEVMKTIQQETDRLEKETGQRRDEVIHTRKHFWDEIKVNVDTFDDYLETMIGLRQEAQSLAVSQSTHRHLSNRLATLKRMLDVPYFGRIDFLEEGTQEAEKIYIGLSTLRDETGEDILIYDWRAPISSVYYDYQPGPASYTTPEGIIEGKLEKKWQYLIRKGELQSMFDTSLTIGDEILQQVLGEGTNKQMDNIVATIQRDQNEIIRHDRGKMLIVHGAAGSGKTSVALQRIAYLLYKYREHLNADQIILFSPNRLFSNYVSNVLPELGEENMQQVTFQEYLTHRIGEDYNVESPYDQLEYVLTQAESPSYNARITGIRLKASAQFYEAIESFCKSLTRTGMKFKNIVFRGETIAKAEEIREKFYAYEPALSLHNRLEKLRDWLIKRISEVEKTEFKKEWVEEEMELLSEEAYHKARIYLAEKRGYTREEIADYEVEPRALAKLIVRLKTTPLRKSIRAFQFINIKAIYKQLFEDPVFIKQWAQDLPDAWENICEQTRQALANNKLFYEDATPFLHVKEQILGFQTNRSIRHIVIDEAQDYSPFQFEFLKRLFPLANMTVLGDFNQAIFAHANEKDDFGELTGLFGADRTDVINLARSYRSTKPIIEFTRSLIPNGERIIPFERDGEPPALTQVSDHDELHASITAKVSELQERGYHSIAIICKSAEESERAYEALAGIEAIKLLKSSSLEYEQGVVVIPSYLSKGIEFDAVIIYDASEEVYGSDSLRRTFYTVCTRAMHELQLYSIGEPSSFLTDALEEGLVRYNNK